MKTIHVILSPHFSDDHFHEEVSGITFKAGRENVEIHHIDLKEHRLTGIQDALRRNILIPYDKETLEFVNGSNISGPEETKPLNVMSVASLSDITVEYGTALESVGLPSKLQASLSNDSEKDLSVEWDDGTPVYDENTAGSYSFKGALTLPEEITNTSGLTGTATVIVKEEAVEPDPEPDPEPEPEPEPEEMRALSNNSLDLESLTVEELKSLAKEMGLSNYSKLKRDELIELINNETEKK